MNNEEEKRTDNQEQEDIEEILSGVQSLKDEVEQEENSGYVSQFRELEEFTEDTETESMVVAKKPKSTKKVVLISVIVVCLLLAGALGVYFVFFDKSIYGAWVNTQTSSDGTQLSTYYVFERNSLETYSANEYVYQKTIYNQVKYDGNTFGILQDGEVSMRCSYNVTGNLIKGKQLSYTMEGYEEREPVEMKSVRKKDIPNADNLKGPKFKMNDKIVGVWEKEDNVEYMEYLIFDETGKMTLFNADNSSMQESVQKYNFDGKELTMAGKTEDTKIKASVDGKTFSVTMESIYVGEIVQKYNKITDEEFSQIKAKLKEGTYEIPTAPTIPIEESTEITTEAVTEFSTKE